MNKTTALLLCLCLSAASCRKDSPSQPPPSTAPSVTWYEGTTLYTATRITATLPNPYAYGNYHTLSASSGSHTLYVVLSNTGVGRYDVQGGDLVVVESDTLGFFDLNVTKNSGDTVSGGFTGNTASQTYLGSFSNITFQ